MSLKPAVEPEVHLMDAPLKSNEEIQEWFQVLEDGVEVQKIFCFPSEVEKRVEIFVESSRLYGYPEFKNLSWQRGFAPVKFQ